MKRPVIVKNHCGVEARRLQAVPEVRRRARPGMVRRPPAVGPRPAVPVRSRRVGRVSYRISFLAGFRQQKRLHHSRHHKFTDRRVRVLDAEGRLVEVVNAEEFKRRRSSDDARGREAIS